MAEERIYTIPLKDAYSAPRGSRARRAVNLLEKYLERHLKGEFSIGPGLNHEIWSRGIKKPPRKVKVTVSKEGEKFMVELFGYKPKKQPEKKKSKREKKKEEKAEKKKEKKKEKKEKKKEKKPKKKKPEKKKKSGKKKKEKKKEKKPKKKKAKKNSKKTKKKGEK